MAVEAGITLPPDSSGKKITTQRNTTLYYVGATAIPFRAGDIVIGSTSGAQGRVYDNDSLFPAGHTHVVQINGSSIDYITGENLLVDNAVKAQLGSVNSAFSQTVVNVGQNNPNNGQFVDIQGSAFVRFAEGSQQLDPQGRTKVSQETVLAEYLHINDPNNIQYSDTTAGAGAIAFDYNTASVILSTGTALGDQVNRVTHRYHKYFLANGTLVNMVVGCSDMGKTGNIRRWGPYDDESGLFFELSATGIQLKLRTSTSGTIVDIPISLSAANGDSVDGNGVSGFTLDPSKQNAYWFDLHWGVRSRVGVLDGRGQRIVIHEITSANAFAYSLVRNPSLPLRFENINTGITESSSSLRHHYSVVSTEGRIDTVFMANYGGGLREQLTVGGAFVPVLGMRAALMVLGHTNRNHIIPISFEVVVEDGLVQLQVIQTPSSITGPTWSTAVSAAELDNEATAISGGRIMWSKILNVGTHTIPLRDIYDISSTCLRLNANGTQGQSIFLIAKKIGAVTPKITATVNWQEVT